MWMGMALRIDWNFMDMRKKAAGLSSISG